MTNIVTLNYTLTGDNVVNTTIDGGETLLDADIVIANPIEFSNVWTHHLLNRNSLPNSTAERIRSIFLSRKNELWTLLENGKVLIVLLTPAKAARADTTTYSGNEYITNYDFLPSAKEFLLQSLTPGKSSIANSILLTNQKHLFSQYFKAFKTELEYSAYLDFDGPENSDYFLVNRSNRPVGFSLSAGNGQIIFLPPAKTNDFKKLIGVLSSCCSKYLAEHEETPPPNWVSDFQLHGESEYEKQLQEINDKIDQLLSEQKKVEESKHNLTKFKGLLYGQGFELENLVMEFFRMIGFTADNRKQDDLEHDIVFESKEGKGIAEIEGKDNDSIHIGKLDQLNRAVDEDFELTSSYPQGILIGNHYRLHKPETRKDPFTEKVLIVAKKKNFGLLTTMEMYSAIEKFLKNPSDEKFLLDCRQKILNTHGEIIRLT
ncbi:MAG: hypothetical protein HOP10_16300 [Chitinophagaceae bacterium]|nr:hypothetical protein [Chitinophagaceae bacterium]